MYLERIIKNKFAQGETVPIKYSKITYAGQTPTSLTVGSKKFYLSVVNYDTRVAALNLTTSNMTIDDNNGDPFVYVPVDTTTLTAKEEYEVDFWVNDPATGKHRIDYFILVLDEPETTSFP